MRLPLFPFLALAAALAVGVPLAVTGDEPPRHPPRHAQHAPDAGTLDMLDLPVFDVMPMHRAVREVGERFDGRIIGMTLLSPRGPEAERGVELVYGFRLLTRGRDVIEIRMDARTGRFLDIRGNDLASARRRK
ncbi:MAG TPA: hypothetical protein PLL33_01215 [Paracoccus sp. (in: a-proteobacteria)]|nr:hypothetical protein [Paracoccus sp. (in: a-proteobacteria)]